MVNPIVFIIKLVVYSSGIRGLWRNSIVVRAFIMIILTYSARKNRAKGPPAYSTLKPDTSLDSPSVRSKGARLVSASVEINHIIATGQEETMSHRCSWVVIRVDSMKDPFRRRTDRRSIARVTS